MCFNGTLKAKKRVLLMFWGLEPSHCTVPYCYNKMYCLYGRTTFYCHATYIKRNTYHCRRRVTTSRVTFRVRNCVINVRRDLSIVSAKCIVLSL